ncbi:hypothetical protein BDR26DRAFT_918614 [Obelidium mucronatum]|nr:hypothetical protein BDR26DRAFT_918614 [Obelidium mucronatum]
MTNTVRPLPPPVLTREQRNRGVLHWLQRFQEANARGSQQWANEYQRRQQAWNNAQVQPCNRQAALQPEAGAELQFDGADDIVQEASVSATEQRRRRVRMGQYVKSQVQTVICAIENGSYVVVHMGDTSAAEVASIWKHAEVVLLFYERELVGYTLNHKNTRIEKHTLEDYYQIIRNFCFSYKKLPEPEGEGHSNSYPDRVNIQKSGMFNFSVRYCAGHWGCQKTRLSISVSSFRSAIVQTDCTTTNLTSESLGNTFKYSNDTQHIVMLVDHLNSLFFPNSMQRKKDVHHLISKHDPSVLWRLKENGLYPLRYIGSGILNPNHADVNDDHEIPSTLLYSGNFRGGDSMLTFPDFNFSIPYLTIASQIHPGTIISFFAWKFNHQVDIRPGFTGVFDERKRQCQYCDSRAAL